MAEAVDCLLIGHNEMDFPQYEKAIREMGVDSGAYRDLNLNFIRYNNRPYSVPEIFNALDARQRAGRKSPYIPLHLGETFSAAIAYLGTYLHRRGMSFDYVNSFQDKKELLAEKLSSSTILTIGIITTLYVSALPLMEIMEFIKTFNQKARVIVGGPFIATKVQTLNREELSYFFQSVGADIYVVSPRGEEALVNIIDGLKQGRPLREVENIYYKSGNEFLFTRVSEENSLLDANMVDWRLFSHNVGEYAAVRTAISCPYNCAFCGFPRHAGPYRTAGVEAVEKELSLLTGLKTVKDVHFIDDTFNVPEERFKAILQVILKNRFEFNWHSYFRCQFVDEETAAAMKETGCEGVFLGIESGSDGILKNMNKATTTQHYLKGIEILKKQGIVTFGNFIIGFPGETEDTVHDTVEFIKKSGLDFFRVQLWYCEPITPIWSQREKYGIKGESFQWSHTGMDFHQACDLIEEVLSTAMPATWVPQYNFDFDTLWHLVHRGISLDRVRDFLSGFKTGIIEKLGNPPGTETGYEVIQKLGNALWSDPAAQEADTGDDLQAGFQF